MSDMDISWLLASPGAGFPQDLFPLPPNDSTGDSFFGQFGEIDTSLPPQTLHSNTLDMGLSGPTMGTAPPPGLSFSAANSLASDTHGPQSPSAETQSWPDMISEFSQNTNADWYPNFSATIKFNGTSAPPSIPVREPPLAMPSRSGVQMPVGSHVTPHVAVQVDASMSRDSTSSLSLMETIDQLVQFASTMQ